MISAVPYLADSGAAYAPQTERRRADGYDKSYDGEIRRYPSGYAAPELRRRTLCAPRQRGKSDFPNRMSYAPVSKFELMSLSSHRKSGRLMSQTNAKQRNQA